MDRLHSTEKQAKKPARNPLPEHLERDTVTIEPEGHHSGACPCPAGKLHTDDTPVTVLQPGRKSSKTGRLWTYVRDDTGWHDPTPAGVWFAYSPDRKADHPRSHLKDFSGYLQADAYGGYSKL